jgi:hypothetical protein
MDDKPEITKTVLYRAAVGTSKADFYVLKFLAFEEKPGARSTMVIFAAGARRTKQTWRALFHSRGVPPPILSVVQPLLQI